MDRRLDEIDRRILYHLTREARDISAPTIAEEVDVSAGTIRNRINQLEADGVIQGYHADVDYERIDGMLTNLLICTAPVDERGRLAQQALELPGVVRVREVMTGRENLHVTVVGTDTDDLTHTSRQLAGLGLEIEDEDLVREDHYDAYQPFGPDSGPQSQVADALSLAGDAEVVEVTVRESAPIAGLTLAAADDEGLLASEALVVAIERGDDVLTPRGSTRLEPGDDVTLFSRERVDEETVAAFAGE